MYLNIFVVGVVSHPHSHLQAFYRSRHQSHISIRGHMETCFVLMQTARPLAKVLGDNEASMKNRGGLGPTVGRGTCRQAGRLSDARGRTWKVWVLSRLPRCGAKPWEGGGLGSGERSTQVNSLSRTRGGDSRRVSSEVTGQHMVIVSYHKGGMLPEGRHLQKNFLFYSC